MSDCQRRRLVHYAYYTQPFDGFFSGTTRGEPAPEEIGLFFWTLWCKGRYQRQTDQQSGSAPLQPSNQLPTSLNPQFWRQMPFLWQLSQFNHAWDRYQMCWLAWQEAWLMVTHAVVKRVSTISTHFTTTRLLQIIMVTPWQWRNFFTPYLHHLFSAKLCEISVIVTSLY